MTLTDLRFNACFKVSLSALYATDQSGLLPNPLGGACCNDLMSVKLEKPLGLPVVLRSMNATVWAAIQRLSPAPADQGQRSWAFPYDTDLRVFGKQFTL